MIAKISIWSVSISILILKTASHLVHHDYSVKTFNTENVILSLGDFDDDLEVIKNEDDSDVEDKLLDFHKFLNTEKRSKRKKKLRHSKEMWWIPSKEMVYPDSPFEIAKSERHLSMLERRQNKIKKERPKYKTGMEVPEKQDKKIPIKVPPKQFTDFEYIYGSDEYLDKKYREYLRKSQKEGTAFKFSDEGKPEETLGDMIEAIIDKSPPKNCTQVLPIGIQAVECIVQDFDDGKLDKAQMFYNLAQILAVWFLIYLAIALPLWCYKGWCCCCWRCRFCFPNKTVQDIQRYLAENPPGTSTGPNGKEVLYNPTQKEIELYERLRRSIAEYY